MAEIFPTHSELEIYRFPGLFYPAIVVAALVLQAYLPLLFHWAMYLDLPLLVVIYYATNARRQAGAAFVGAGMGILQDSVSHLALGLNGIAQALAGYLAASLGGRIDAEHSGIRFLTTAVLYGLDAAVVFVIERYLMAEPVLWWGGRILAAAVLNGIVAILIFRLFDRFRQLR